MQTSTTLPMLGSPRNGGTRRYGGHARRSGVRPVITDGMLDDRGATSATHQRRQLRALERMETGWETGEAAADARLTIEEVAEAGWEALHRTYGADRAIEALVEDTYGNEAESFAGCWTPKALDDLFDRPSRIDPYDHDDDADVWVEAQAVLAGLNYAEAVEAGTVLGLDDLPGWGTHLDTDGWHGWHTTSRP